LEVVKILEASSESLRQHGAAVNLGATAPWNNGHHNGHANGNANTNGNGKNAPKGNGAALVVPAETQSVVAA